ncbi:MAG TPA: hypothetical protein VFA46_04840 [Actinomycetes bacterium]|jgi:hypothetical protein|nr:hypothetical protein [Actinomycetes bacterium]
MAAARSSHEEPLAARLLRGAVGGLLSGMVFAAVAMWYADSVGGNASVPLHMISTIIKGNEAMLRGTSNVGVGLAIHAALSILYGALFGLAVPRFRTNGTVAIAGTVYGALLFSVNFLYAAGQRAEPMRTAIVCLSRGARHDKERRSRPPPRGARLRRPCGRPAGGSEGEDLEAAHQQCPQAWMVLVLVQQVDVLALEVVGGVEGVRAVGAGPAIRSLTAAYSWCARWSGLASSPTQAVPAPSKTSRTWSPASFSSLVVTMAFTTRASPSWVSVPARTTTATFGMPLAPF